MAIKPGKSLYPANFIYTNPIDNSLLATITKASEKMISEAVNKNGQPLDVTLPLLFNERLVHLCSKLPTPETVFIMHSEEDAVALNNLGLLASSVLNRGPWQTLWNPYITRAEVVLLWDQGLHDADAFLKYAEQFQASSNIRFIALPLGFSNLRSYLRQRKLGAFSVMGMARKLEYFSTAAERSRVFTPAANFLGRLEPIDYLVEGFLERNTVSSLLGKTSSFKSFLSVQISSCIATGTPWCGRLVKKGAVFYFGLEAVNGVKRRIAAQALELGLDLRDPNTFSNFFLSSVNVELSSAESMEMIKSSIQKIVSQDQAHYPALIVVDTFARAMGSADENDAKSISLVFKQLQESLLSTFPGASVLFVTHTGHSDSTRQRGSSAIKAALDSEILVTRDGDLAQVTVSKIKDGRKPEPLFFKFEEVDLTQFSTSGPGGDEIKTGVLRLKESLLDLRVGSCGAKRNIPILLGELLSLVREEEVTKQRLADEFDIGSGDALRMLLKCVELGFLNVREGAYFSLSETGKKQLDSA